MSVKQGGNTIAGASTTDTANKNLSNLNSQGQNIANWSTNVANCITEIPQDIKLELNNGTLTLKAGSVLYEPSGAGNFIKHTTTQDYTWAYGTGQYIIIAQKSGNIGQTTALAKSYSGATAPANPSAGDVWYDTTNNVIKRYGTSWVAADFCLPIAIVTSASGTVTSIDQVFNGFGYIGSTVFALPNVKGLIPNGRNADGSLKNIEWTNDSVKIITSTLDEVSHIVIGNTREFDSYINMSGFQGVFNTPPPVAGNWGTYYNNNENIMYVNYNGQWNRTNRLLCAGISVSSGRITSFTPKTLFHAVDRNDSSWIAQQAMPSTRYIDLTLGASGSTYTAPANGWYSISKRASAVNQYVEMDCNSLGSRCYSPYGDTLMAVYVPASKGSTMKIYYNAGGATSYFRFIYAEGEN